MNENVQEKEKHVCIAVRQKHRKKLQYLQALIQGRRISEGKRRP